MVYIAGVKLHTNKIEKARDAKILKINSDLIANAVLSWEILGGISTTWSDSIKSGNDFNTKITEFLNSKKIQLEKMEATNKAIKEGMRELKDYPIKYKEIYNISLDLYGVYNQLYFLALAPSGNVGSFNNKMNDLTSEFIKIKNKLEIYIPKLKEQATESLLKEFDDIKTKMSNKLQAEAHKAEEEPLEKERKEEERLEKERKAEEERLEKERAEKEQINKQTKLILQYYEAGDEKEALSLYNKVIVLDASLPKDMYFYIGNIYYSSKQYEKAVKPYEKALSINKNFVICRALADIYSRLERFNEAIDYYKKALEINPNDIQTTTDLAKLYVSLKKYEDAIALYKDALQKSTTDSYFYEKLGALYSSLNRYDDAIAIFKNAITKCGYDNSFKFHNYLGNIYYIKKQYYDAIGEYVSALFANSENPEYNFNLGRAQLAYGDSDKAIYYLKIAESNGKKAAELYYYLGKAYTGSKEYVKAEKAFSEAMKLCQDPQFKIEIQKAIETCRGLKSQK